MEETRAKKFNWLVLLVILAVLVAGAWWVQGSLNANQNADNAVPQEDDADTNAAGSAKVDTSAYGEFAGEVSELEREIDAIQFDPFSSPWILSPDPAGAVEVAAHASQAQPTVQEQSPPMAPPP